MDSYFSINKIPKLNLTLIQLNQIQNFLRFILISDHLPIHVHVSEYIQKDLLLQPE